MFRFGFNRGAALSSGIFALQSLNNWVTPDGKLHCTQFHVQGKVYLHQAVSIASFGDVGFPNIFLIKRVFGSHTCINSLN